MIVLLILLELVGFLLAVIVDAATTALMKRILKYFIESKFLWLQQLRLLRVQRVLNPGAGLVVLLTENKIGL